MSFEIPEVQEKSPRAHVFEMQKRHRDYLNDIGLAKRAFLNAARDTELTIHDIADIQNGQPVVLGVEEQDKKTVFIAFQNPDINNNGTPIIRSTLVFVGSRMGESIAPNSAKGYTLDDFVEVERLYDEAKVLQQTIAPNYNIEQGIVGE